MIDLNIIYIRVFCFKGTSTPLRHIDISKVNKIPGLIFISYARHSWQFSAFSLHKALRQLCNFKLRHFAGKIFSRKAIYHIGVIPLRDPPHKGCPCCRAADQNSSKPKRDNKQNYGCSLSNGLPHWPGFLPCPSQRVLQHQPYLTLVTS